MGVGNQFETIGAGLLGRRATIDPELCQICAAGGDSVQRTMVPAGRRSAPWPPDALDGLDRISKSGSALRDFRGGAL